MRIELLNHRDPAVADRIHDVLSLAHEQENAILRLTNHEVPGMTSEEIRQSAAYHFGASRTEELLGWISLSADAEPGQISIAMLVVHPAHQRHGIARALLEHVLQQGNGAVFCVIAAASNVPALALYASLGFVERRRGAMGPGALEVIELKVRSQPALE